MFGFQFSTTCLLINPIRWNIKKDKGLVTTYNAADIERDVSTEMTRDGAILFGLLSGGDYHSVCTVAVHFSFI